ncbi:hypothetical protein [Hymenobacter metallilatus]|uniref:Uncharacterized protein n=1 Tax=Hymenobacter metallilatus TaxID=2493666 RepID=A0A428JLS0_9BACT|nr:hypothetical protein [Hymenobacter metallilatus]RSK33929.1 hypothetical protein EI290_09495 [Hymenobacter metallilatus]
MLLATASFNPSFHVVPAKLPTAASLEFWLQNPLLVETHPKLLAERTEQWPGWSPAERTQLRYRLKAERDRLKEKAKPGEDDLTLHDLLSFIEAHNGLLDNGVERSAVRHFAFMLHSRERAWYRAFLKEVFRLRELALHEEIEQMYDECDRDAA